MGSLRVLIVLSIRSTSSLGISFTSPTARAERIEIEEVSSKSMICMVLMMSDGLRATNPWFSIMKVLYLLR